MNLIQGAAHVAEPKIAYILVRRSTGKIFSKIFASALAHTCERKFMKLTAWEDILMKRLRLVISIILVMMLGVFMFTACSDEPADSGIVISYYKMQGSSLTDISVTDPDNFTLNVPTRAGYKFLGLYDASEGGTQIFNENGIPNVKIDRSMTLWAQWEARTVGVYFDAGEGEIIGAGAAQTFKYDSEFNVFPLADREGYDFLGWAYRGELCSDEHGFVNDGYGVLNFQTYSTEDDGKIHFTAVYEIKKLTVTFDYNDGSFMSQTVTVNYGDTVALSDFPFIDTGSKETKAWSFERNSSAPVTADVVNLKADTTFYALWREYRVSLFYEIPGGEGTSVKIYKDASNSPYVPERGGYEFDGWYENASLSGNPVTGIQYHAAKDKYYAKWNLITYTVTFSVSGDHVGNTADRTYNVETDLLLPTVEKDKYTFLGWCRNADLSDEPIKVIESGNFGNVTLYAKFKGDDRTVLLDANGGQVMRPTVTLEYGAINTLPVPSYADYAFNGWCLENGTPITDRNGVTLAEYLFDGEVTLVAKYTKKYYITVDIPYSAGTVQKNEYYVAGEEVILKFVASDEGYRFGGFLEGGAIVSSAKTYGFVMPASDVHLTISLTPGTFEITFNVDGGYDIPESSTVTYKESYELPTAYKRGYVFAGWMLDGTLITDKDGKSLGVWTGSSNATVKASYTKDESGITTHYISTPESFVGMFKAPGDRYVLIADIDFSGIKYTVPTVDFTGFFDGNQHTIKNLTISATSENVGVFGKVKGTVKNVAFENVNITTTSNVHSKIGVVASYLDGGTISGVTIKSGLINVPVGSFGDIGGVVGGMLGGTLTNCESYLIINGNTHESTGSTGGIVGWVSGGTVSSSRNYGTVSGKFHTGGVVGGASSAAGALLRLENHGQVSGALYTGGVVGTVENANVPQGFVNKGSVVGKNYTGGLVGNISIGAQSVTYATVLVNEGDVVGENYTGGIFGQLRSYSNVGWSDRTGTITVSNMSNVASITGTHYVGGIIGHVEVYCDSNYTGWVRLDADNLYNTGAISGESHVGGLFGYAYSDNGDSSVKNSTVKADIRAGEYMIGAIAGRLNNIRLDSSSNSGSRVILTGFHINGTSYEAYLGGYVGSGYAVTNCHNAVVLSYSQNAAYVGGIAGFVNGNVQACSNTADITATTSAHVGGLVGRASYGGIDINFNNLQNTGDISGANNTAGIIGSFYNYSSVGWSDSIKSINMTNLINKGDVSGGSYVGGVFGHFHAQIDSNYTGIVKLVASALKNEADIDGAAYVGGLIGHAYSDDTASVISDSASTGLISADYYVGGLAGSLQNIALKTCSNKGTTFSVNGYMIDGTSYYAYFGGYAGRCYSVSGCINESEIVYNERGMRVGGIAGYTDGILSDVVNYARVYAPKANDVGGIAGKVNYGGGSVEWKNLKNTGSITGKDSTGGVIGNLYSYASVGWNDSIQNVKLTTLENFGDVIGENYTGGVFGYYYTNIDSNYTGIISMVANLLKNEANVTGSAYVGGIFGYAYTDTSDSTLSSSSSRGVITAKYYVGGLGGKVELIKMVNCSNAGTTINATEYQIDGTNYYAFVGGYAGYGYVFDGCTNESNITYSERGMRVGGIVGYTTGYVINCHNSGNILAAKASRVGGIVGEAVYGAESLNFENLGNTGDVTGADYVGGIIGKFYTYASVGWNDCTRSMTFKLVSNTADVSGKNYVGGIVGHMHMQIDSNYTGWSRLVANQINNIGAVTAENYAGGIFGYFYSDGTTSVAIYSSEGPVSATLSGGVSSMTAAVNTNATFEE